MTDKPFYPTITDSTLAPIRGVLHQMELFPNYLYEKECTYTDSVKEFLYQLQKKGQDPASSLPVEVANIEEDYAGDKHVFLETQIIKLLKDIEVFNAGLRTRDHKEKLDFFKMKQVLMEKLISSQERIFNLREVSEFQSIIMQFLEEVCDKDQVAELMKRLSHLESITTKPPKE